MEEQLKNKDMNETKYCYPTEETWFICWEDTRVTIKAYGSIEPTQCLTSPYNEVDYYTDESVWAAILLENGINPLHNNEIEELIK